MKVIAYILSLLTPSIWVHHPLEKTLRLPTFATTRVKVVDAGRLAGFGYIVEDTAGPGYIQLSFRFAVPDIVTIRSNQCTVVVRSAESFSTSTCYNLFGHKCVYQHEISPNDIIMIEMGRPRPIFGYIPEEAFYDRQIATLTWLVERMNPI